MYMSCHPCTCPAIHVHVLPSMYMSCHPCTCPAIHVHVLSSMYMSARGVCQRFKWLIAMAETSFLQNGVHKGTDASRKAQIQSRWLLLPARQASSGWPTLLAMYRRSLFVCLFVCLSLFIVVSQTGGIAFFCT